ncbi:MAG TPA: ABC-F family ATP-binding cassette domain-containing protein, partial [Firmicutes bacterium]|nr:ABC-F family ATP-binding cassette domain-containing protein [Bacillota bacterium]
MPTLLSFNRLVKSFGDKEVFLDLKGEINAPTIIGLVGDNGCGKSTLLRVLAGLEPADSGEIQRPSSLQIAYLPQELPTGPELSAFEFVRNGSKYLVELERKLRELEQQLPNSSSSEGPKLLQRYGELLHEFEQQGGYEL